MRHLTHVLGGWVGKLWLRGERQEICNQDRSIASQQNLEMCVLGLPIFCEYFDTNETIRPGIREIVQR